MRTNAYMIATISNRYMFPYDGKIYKKLKTAEEKCFEINKVEDSGYVVLCADNWHELEKVRCEK